MTNVAFTVHELAYLRPIDVQTKDFESPAGEELGDRETDIAKSDNSGRYLPVLDFL
jgi:hypothetical protein